MLSKLTERLLKVKQFLNHIYPHFINTEKTFSQKLIEFREQNGLLQKEMADILDISERMYIYYEKGKYDGSTARTVKYLRKLSEYLTKDKNDNSSNNDRYIALKKENELQNRLIIQLEREIEDLREKVRKQDAFKIMVFDSIKKGLTMLQLEELIKNNAIE